MNIPSALTATLGRYPAVPLLGAGPTSLQLGAAVLLETTPTSVATYRVPFVGVDPESTSTPFAGASGRLALKSVQEDPPLVVCHRCDVGKFAVLKPMTLM